MGSSSKLEYWKKKAEKLNPKQWKILLGSAAGLIVVIVVIAVVLANNVGLMVSRADALLENGKPEQAREAYIAALDRQEDFVPAILGLANAEVAVGDPNAALHLLEEKLTAVDDEQVSDLYEQLLPTHEIDLEAGTYQDRKQVVLSSKRSDVRLYYTLDGSEPDEGSAVYEQPIELPVGKSKLAVMAIAENGARGKVESREYNLDLRAPDPVTATPMPGTYDTEQVVALTAYPGDAIYYTLDGSEPTEQSTLYDFPASEQPSGEGEPSEEEPPADGAEADDPAAETDPDDVEEPAHGIEIGEGVTTIKAIAITDKGVVSETATFVYTLTDMKPHPVAFDVEGGVYSSEQTIHLTADKETYKIYYTLNGLDPTEDSALYEKELVLEDGFNGVVRAIAVSETGKSSDVVEVGYVIQVIRLPDAPVDTAADQSASRSPRGTLGPVTGGGETDGGAAVTPSTGGGSIGGSSGGASNIATTTDSNAAYACAQLTNQLRSSLGLSQLTIDSNLMAAAQQRAYEMTANNYYSHTRPDGRWYNTAALDYGFSTYKRACENIAMCTFGVPNNRDWTISNVVTGQYWYSKWKGSNAHYINMTRKNLTKIGVGIAYRCDDGMYTVMASMLLL